MRFNLFNYQYSKISFIAFSIHEVCTSISSSKIGEYAIGTSFEATRLIGASKYSNETSTICDEISAPKPFVYYLHEL